MSLDNTAYIALGIALLVLLSARQLAWQPLRTGRLVQLPVLLIGGGAFLAEKTWDAAMIHGAGLLDAVLLAVQIVLAVGGGLLMGRLVQLSPDGRQVSTRLRPIGLVIWFAVIILRLGFDGLAHVLGAELAGDAVIILVMLGIVKGTQALVIGARVRSNREVPWQYAH
jgi:hypothetical protein